MKSLIFATNNNHKLEEAKQILSSKFNIISLNEIGFNQDIPETENTLEGNALLKARTIYNETGKACFADDTGLEVYSLNNEPGVYSARYAGEPVNSLNNMNMLLKNMICCDDRRARFRTVIALINGKEENLFEGIVEGKITLEPHGEKGFGYDPVFIPENEIRTFAEMTESEKNVISHRGRAFGKMAEFLLDQGTFFRGV